LTTEYARYLERLNNIVYTEVVPKLALVDFFTEHAYKREPDLTSKEPLIWYIQSGLLSDITFSLHRLVDSGSNSKGQPTRSIRHFLNYTRDNIAAIDWKEPLTLSDIYRHKNALRAVRDEIGRLDKRRNTFFGHYDDEFFFNPDKLDEDYPFSNEDAKTLVRTFQGILSDHNWAFAGRGSISMEHVVYVAAESLLERILSDRKVTPEKPVRSHP
jgi:hypothetical protein